MLFIEPGGRFKRLIKDSGFRCPFRVGIEVLLAARLGQRPQVGRAALLSAVVTACKPRHYEWPDESPALFLSPPDYGLPIA